MNLVIDGSNLLHRAYWVAETREPLVNTKGVWTGPVFIFLKSLKSLCEKFEPENVWVTWDKRIKYPSTNFRKQLLPEEYKQNRDHAKNQKVHDQQAVVEKWLIALGIYQIYPYVLEADDVISWLVQEKVPPATIVTIDKDLLQLVNRQVRFYNPLKKILITEENFEQEVDTTLADFLNIKALMGDKSDNIPGIPGYGPQKSKKLACQGYKTILETLTDEDKDIFIRNYKIMSLKDSYLQEDGEKESYEEQFITQMKEVLPDLTMFKQFCDEFEMKTFIKDIEDWKRVFIQKKSLNHLILQLM
jgi:DNA polymerase-1